MCMYVCVVPPFNIVCNIHAVQIVRRYFENVWNEEDTAVMSQICSEDLILTDPCCWRDPFVGRDRVVKVIEEYLTAFKAFHYTSLQILGTPDGESVMAKWTATAVHLGDFLGRPASGRVQEISGMSHFTFAGRKIARIDTFRETLCQESIYADYEL
jgi:steroid delta-isomerase-like uncharacterized protein